MLENYLKPAIVCLFLGGLPALCQAQNSVFLEELTTLEVTSALRAGKTTVIIPVGGTEQNGPHMAIGKHNMRARVTINLRFEVIDIEAVTDEMPYPGQCNRIGPDYKKLIGSNLLKGFRKSIAENMGGVKGCTHLSELLGYLPTAAVQTFAGIKNEVESVEGKRPFQLDSCHALATNSETVRVYYPKWFVGEFAPARDEFVTL